MRLVRFGAAGDEKPGLIDADNVLRDLSLEIEDLSGSTLSRASLARIAAIDPKSLPKADPASRLGPPVAGTTNFVAVGLNYADHAAETGAPIPAEPILFSKAVSSIVGPRDDILIPPGSTKLDWEVELAIVIGEAAFNVSEAEALGHVAGFCLCNDVSERAWQTERGGQWVKGKSAPTFGPLGPWLVTPDEIADIQAVDLWLKVGSDERQAGSTATMIFGVAKLISYISGFMRLMPGDVITTGTPPGVGMGMKPPTFLKEGDIVSLGGAGLGEQRQTVRATP
ncbi:MULTISPECIES: fumarylacetoacetate hydrolase family protein [unclassified Aureimonas]|uniref:fumarylacetoacetate hydrolase family protein n=1 Tax=unclassified Aureimonas TaxID=2615206 RepID=UPI0007015D67|nr:MULTISPECIES: fumarylacetoacetate hydrolase family protein [unclassified Aureimonas]KQT69945.1 2-hydroxyhepta-2,4-diene-1,7-dioate isomerase [Aureimonas sp. Leaf427]KQT75899.1 2-hydroxyhepta-2,4-diene-1,7-dioate isomerase [Aureimonas sp. Leaf460]